MSRAVTISILTYKRHQHLRRALASALRYADQVAEIIVVDNAAEPELKSMLAAEYPERALHRRGVQRADARAATSDCAQPALQS